MDFWNLRREMDRFFNQMERLPPFYTSIPTHSNLLTGQENTSGQGQGQGQVTPHDSKSSLMSTTDLAWPSSSSMNITLDVHETDKSYNIAAELPGMNKEEISIGFENGVLTISGEKKSSRDESKNNYYISERTFGKVTRSLRLPRDVDAEKATAQYQNGVLTLEMPKKAVPSTKIAIK